MSEVLNLRVKDIDFGFDKVYIWDSKSLKDRTIPLPAKLKEILKLQVENVKQIHKQDFTYLTKVKLLYNLHLNYYR